MGFNSGFKGLKWPRLYSDQSPTYSNEVKEGKEQLEVCAKVHSSISTVSRLWFEASPIEAGCELPVDKVLQLSFVSITSPLPQTNVFITEAVLSLQLHVFKQETYIGRSYSLPPLPLQGLWITRGDKFTSASPVPVTVVLCIPSSVKCKRIKT